MGDYPGEILVSLSKYNGKAFVVILVCAKWTRLFRGTAYLEDTDVFGGNLHYASGRAGRQRSQILRIAVDTIGKEIGSPEFIIHQESADRIEPDLEHGCDYCISITLATDAEDGRNSSSRYTGPTSAQKS